MLFDELTVAENIFLGHAPRSRFGLIDWRAMNADARARCSTASAPRSIPTTRLRDLGIASKHLVAIARALSVDARVVIMDEPTAALSHKEIDELYELVEQLKAEGKAILFITPQVRRDLPHRRPLHRVPRRRAASATGAIGEVDRGRSWSRMMVGRSIDADLPQARRARSATTVLTVAGYCHPTEFADIGFTLRRGEILGFYGLVGAGRSEVMQALFGITRPSQGRGAGSTARSRVIRSPGRRDRRRHRLCAGGARRQGAITGAADLPEHHPALARRAPRARGFLRLAEEFALARDYAERLDLRAAALDQEVGTLSGGNQQKVVIAKWLATEPQGHHPRRADQGHRHRLQGRGARLHERAGGAGAGASSWSPRRSPRSSACPTG